VPTFYEIKDENPLKYDFLGQSRELLNNKVWERKYSFGDTLSLKGLAPEDIQKAELILFPYYWISEKDYLASKKIDDAVKKYFDTSYEGFTEIVKQAKVGCSRNIAVFDFEFAFDLEGVSNDPYDWKEEFIISYHRCVGIVKEVGALFRTACYLLFHCMFPIMPNMKSPEGGLIQISSMGKYYSGAELTSEYSYPAIFIPDKVESLQKIINVLSKYWHLSMWPLFRYLKALSGTYIQMEDFLDLLFSLEGLFDKNASSDFIKLACSVLTSESRAEAIHTQDLLDCAYRMRNEIVHGGISYDGFEKINIGGKEELSQTVFFELRKIVAKILNFALAKLLANSEMRNLRINLEDVLNHHFLKK
jgi:hypothetical protein